MPSVNKVILMGGLGRDPEVRYMPNGEAVANFSIATTETWKDKSGQKQQKSEWHNIVMYRRLAEIAEEYLKKGSQVYIEGKLQTRKWEKDGVTRYSTEINADHMQMLGGNRSEGGNEDKADDDYSGDETKVLNKDHFKNALDAVKKGNFDDFDDDIPF